MTAGCLCCAQNYEFLDALFGEAIVAFGTSDIFHAGGDEFDAGCWDSVPAVKAFRLARNWTATQLLQHYMTNIFTTITKRGKAPMVWKPGVADHLPTAVLPDNLIFDLYSGPTQLPPDGQGGYNISAAAVTAQGYRCVSMLSVMRSYKM